MQLASEKNDRNIQEHINEKVDGKNCLLRMYELFIRLYYIIFIIYIIIIYIYTYIIFFICVIYLCYILPYYSMIL